MSVSLTPRFKTKGPFITSLTVSGRQNNMANCTQSGMSVVSTASYQQSYEYEEMSGQSIKGWNKLRNAGELLPFTNFFHKYHNFQVGSCQRDFCRSSGSNRRFTYDIGWTPGWSHSVPTTLDIETWASLPDLAYYTQAAAAKIQSSGFDALTFIAELASTRRMFTGILTKIVNLIKRGKLERLENLWLEGRYGWRTLRYDLQDLSKALKSLDKEQKKRYNQKVGHSYSTQKSFIVQGTSSGITSVQTETYSLDVSVRGCVIADIAIDAFQFNPVVTAWELIPFSFVLDWLINVGQSLSALSFALNVKSYQASVGYFISYQGIGDFQTVSHDSTVATIYSNFGSYLSYGFVERRIPSSVHFNPMFKLRLDEFKYLDILALIIQRVR